MRTFFNWLKKANHYTTVFAVFRTMMGLDIYVTLSSNRKKTKTNLHLGTHIRAVFFSYCPKLKTKLTQLPIRTKVNIIINQWELKVKAGNVPEVRENASDQVMIGFSFASDWSRW